MEIIDVLDTGKKYKITEFINCMTTRYLYTEVSMWFYTVYVAKRNLKLRIAE